MCPLVHFADTWTLHGGSVAQCKCCLWQLLKLETLSTLSVYMWSGGRSHGLVLGAKLFFDHQPVVLFPVSWVVAFGDLFHHLCVVCKFNESVCEVDWRPVTGSQEVEAQITALWSPCAEWETWGLSRSLLCTFEASAVQRSDESAGFNWSTCRLLTNSCHVFALWCVDWSGRV